MSDIDRARALEKIKKCLALSESNNPHEAESALRQARKLMDKFHLDYSDADASRAQEHEFKIGTGSRAPARWVRMLANTVGTSMGCVTFFRHGSLGQSIIFIGETGNAELAAYAYEILLRQLERQRKEFVCNLDGYEIGAKRKLGARFAEGWIGAIAAKVSEFGGVSAEGERAINAYCSRAYPEVKVSKMPRRKINLLEYKAMLAGEEEGEKVSLHKPVGRGEEQLLLV